MNIIVDYGAGNLVSVLRAFRLAGSEARISADPEEVARAKRIVLPGVGFFDVAMENLRSTGILPVLERRVRQEGTPILGICLGMQMFTRFSEEGNAPGLGWIDAETKRFRPAEAAVKVPHLGWNEIQSAASCPLLKGLPPESCFYFAHSYYVDCAGEAAVKASTRYGVEFAAVIQQDNIFGVQFHPEKSHDNGLHFLRRFLELTAHA
jgi:glutamine amidotransferase